MKDVIVLGDSHIHCLAVAAGHAPSPMRFVMADAGTITDDFILRTMDGETILNPLVQHALARANAVDHFSGEFLYQGELCLLFGFTASHRLGYNPLWKSWHLSGSGVALPEKSRGVVTEPMLDDMLEHELRHFRKGIKLLYAKFRRPIHLLPGPPPYSTNDAIVNTRSTATDMFPDPGVRLMVWKSLYRLVKRWEDDFTADKVDFRVVALPGDVRDSNGFLRAEFMANDGIHANTAYGERLVRHLTQVFG